MSDELSEAQIDNMRRAIDPPFRYVDEKFGKLLDDLIHLICEYGLKSVRPRSRRPFSMQYLGLRRRRVFFKNVHKGWKLAQRRILFEIHGLTDEHSQHKTAEGHAHRDKKGDEKKVAKSRAALCNWKIFVLRRLLDSICWSILKGEHHVIRRLHQNRLQPAPTVEEVGHIWPQVVAYNSNPMQIAIVADATTFISTCDLLVSNVEQHKTAFIELKSGKKNIEISRAAHFAVVSGCARFESSATDGMTPTDKKHFARAKRQVQRMESIKKVVETGVGTDHRTGSVIHTPEMPIPVRHFDQHLVDLAYKIDSGKNWAIDVVDDCLYIGAYRDREMMTAFFPWVWSKGRAGRVYNLLESFNHPLVRPLTSVFLPADLINKIVRCQISFLLFLDVEAWIERSNNLSSDHQMFLETLEKTRKGAPNFKYYEPALHEGRLIGVKRGKEISFLGQGSLDRIFFDLQRPLNLTSASVFNFPQVLNPVSTEKESRSSSEMP